MERIWQEDDKFVSRAKKKDDPIVSVAAESSIKLKKSSADRSFRHKTIFWVRKKGNFQVIVLNNQERRRIKKK